jgi:hypothetical protein
MLQNEEENERHERVTVAHTFVHLTQQPTYSRVFLHSRIISLPCSLYKSEILQRWV